MKTNIHTYIDIQGISLNRVMYYVVTKRTTYDIVLFGTIIKNVDKTEELPFVFKSIEIAKDFCELNPKIKKFLFAPKGHLKYETYDLIMNNKVHAYIVWDIDTKSVEYKKYDYDDKRIFPREVYPIVNGFVKCADDIKLDCYNYASSIYDAHAQNVVEKLSDIFNISKNDKYHFELVEK